MEAPHTPSSSIANKRSEKAFSCVRCFDRKVKCNKVIPCIPCTKAGVECVFRQPAPPRRRKKRTHEEILLARLKHCEDILKSHGISPESQSQDTEATPELDNDDARYEASLGSGAMSRYLQAARNETLNTKNETADPALKNSGSLVVEQGRTKFFENQLYSGLNEELQQNEELLENSTEDEAEPFPGGFANAPQSLDFMLDISPTSAPLISLHPAPDQIYKIWQVFLDNINPLIKIIHQPTLQSEIFDASFNLEKVSKGLEALMFAIYVSATYSMTEQDCTTSLREDKESLLAKFRLGLRKALVRANFLGTSELMVLQAFVIYLMSMRMLYDARTMWILSGVANRLAQSLGLHRDGSTLGLSPFDTEMRRRLWWQLIILDGRSAELSGSSRTFELRAWDTKVPANVNDADLWPQMTEAPVSAIGTATEMISCSMRYELGEFLRRSQTLSRNGIDGDWQTLRGQIDTDEKDKVIQELENLFQDKYIRFCDPSIPVHFHTIIVARTVVASMRLMTHHPRHRSDKDRPQSKEELDMVFGLALKIVEYSNLAQSSPTFQRFLWHSHVYFQWQAFLYLLGDLRARTEGPEADSAWTQIEQVYHYHPLFITDTKKALHVASGRLCLKAWAARETALMQQGKAVFPSTTPDFIVKLRQEQQSKRPSVASQSPLPNNLIGQYAISMAHPGDMFPNSANTNMDFRFDNGLEQNLFTDLSIEDISPMNWTEWDNMVNAYGTLQPEDWTHLPGLSNPQFATPL